MFTVKDNGPETFTALAALDWAAPSVRHHRTPPEKGHGRVETRHIDALTLPERMTPFAHARQAMRVTRERTDLTTGNTTTETACALTSVSAERAGPAQLLAWNQGHPHPHPSGRIPRITPSSNRTHPLTPTACPAPTSSVKPSCPPAASP